MNSDESGPGRSEGSTEFERSWSVDRVAMTTDDVRDLLGAFRRQFRDHFPDDLDVRSKIEVERRGVDTRQILNLEELASDLSTGRLDTVTAVYQSLTCGSTSVSVRITSSWVGGAFIRVRGKDLVTVSGLAAAGRDRLREYGRWKPPEWAVRGVWALPALFLGAAAGSIAATDGDKLNITLLWLGLSASALALSGFVGLPAVYIYGKLVPHFELTAPREATRWRKIRNPVLAAVGTIITFVVGGVLLALLTS